MPFIEPIQPHEEMLTEWTNPLEVRQEVLISIDDPRRPTRYVWEPGQTRKMPSAYDQIIQKTHNGKVIGGLAPQLRRAGQSEQLDIALDSRANEKAAADAQLAAAALAKAAQEQAMILATQRLADIQAKDQASAAAIASAPPAQTKSSKG